MEEIWKEIEGSNGHYYVSNTGRVKSIDRIVCFKNGVKKFFKGQELKPSFDSDRYCILTIRRNGKRITQKVHRLVAEAFIPNPLNLPCVNHKDEDKTNNSVENLEWCDIGYNDNYGSRNERMSKTLKGRVFTAEHRKNISLARYRLFSQTG